MKILSVLMVLVMLSACAKQISPNVYSESSVGKVQDTYEGVVLSVQNVMIQGADQLEDNNAGKLTGAIAGGVAGAQVGKGSGKVAAAAGGVILGGILGALAENELSEQAGVEYIVKLINEAEAGSKTVITKGDFINEETTYTKKGGRLITIVQGHENRLMVGQRVFVLVDSKGRSRVIADPTAGQINAAY